MESVPFHFSGNTNVIILNNSQTTWAVISRQYYYYRALLFQPACVILPIQRLFINNQKGLHLQTIVTTLHLKHNKGAGWVSPGRKMCHVPGFYSSGIRNASGKKKTPLQRLIPYRYKSKYSVGKANNCSSIKVLTVSKFITLIWAASAFVLLEIRFKAQSCSLSFAYVPWPQHIVTSACNNHLLGEHFSFSARSVVVEFLDIPHLHLMQSSFWSGRVVQQPVLITAFPFPTQAIFILSRKKLCLFLHLGILLYHKV